MDLLKKSTIIYVNQVRQDNFEKLIGKGFSEALSWRESFKQIIFVCYSSSKNYIYKKLNNNFYLIGLPFDISASAYKTIFSLIKNYLNLFSFLNKLSKMTDINIIRVENLLLAGPPLYFLSKIKKIPYVIWLGGHERKAIFIKYNKNLFTWLLAKLVVIYEKIILKNSNFVFPVTDELYDLAKKRNVKNMLLSPNFVDRNKFKEIKLKGEPKEKVQILFVERFEEEKGIKVLLEAIKILSKESDRFKLNMVGDGSLKEWVKHFIVENQVSSIELLGTFTHDDMPEVYNAADIFILPSYTEGSPASLIEAMSCGTASIATSVGECKKIIKNGENGFLIPPGDSRIMANTLNNLIENNDLRVEFGEKGRISIIKYTMNYKKIHKYVFQQILKLYNI